MVVLCHEFSYSNEICARCTTYNTGSYVLSQRVYVLASRRYYRALYTTPGTATHIHIYIVRGGDYYAGHYKSRSMRDDALVNV